jgi:hypothetical protein
VLDYLWEYAGRVIRRVDVVFGLAINVIALIVALISGLEYTTVALMAVSILGLVLLWGGFAVFQEERHKTDSSLEVRVLPLHYYPEPDKAIRVHLHETGRLHAFVRLHYFLVNHLPSDVEVMRCDISWQITPRLGRGQRFARLPFRSLGEDSRGPAFPMRLAGASKSSEFEGTFETTFVPDSPSKLPRRFRFIMEIDVAGAPGLSLPVAAFRLPEWRRPTEAGMVFIVSPDRLLGQFGLSPTSDRARSKS